jgi:predicted ester cyclase
MVASCSIGLCLVTGLAVAAATVASAGDETLPPPKRLIVAPGAEQAAAAVLLPARHYYAFWNSGDERQAFEALAPDFVDLNLPAGRLQGPAGPLLASRTFRAAVPDLTASAEEAWVTGDQVITRLRFAGHFTGRFGDRAGDGSPIAFDAIDIYTVRSGRIASNWHLEDNLTLLKQLGVVSP